MTITALFVMLISLLVLAVCNRQQEDALLRSLIPIKPEENIMFWRPQKVGSSTIVSLLVSYGFRYNLVNRRKQSSNSFCRTLAKCTMGKEEFKNNETDTKVLRSFLNKGVKKTSRTHEPEIPFHISATHEVCNLPHQYIEQGLSCGFQEYQQIEVSTPPPAVKEIFLVRNPLDRALSVYYFWGELFVISNKRRAAGGSTSGLELSLGKTVTKGPVRGLFVYHGNEQTVPTEDIAIQFANTLPYRAGMPGPSYTWSLFANSPLDALTLMNTTQPISVGVGGLLPLHDSTSDAEQPNGVGDGTDTSTRDILTLVTERMDESLVLMAHHLGWSLADVVVTKPRKSLSGHPKSSAWPSHAVDMLDKVLEKSAENTMYRTANRVLDRRLNALRRAIGNSTVNQEIELLQQLRTRVTKVRYYDTLTTVHLVLVWYNFVDISTVCLSACFLFFVHMPSVSDVLVCVLVFNSYV